jgi:hypothetical protein
MKSASWMHSAEACSKSFPILSVASALARTFSRESPPERCLLRKRRNGSIISVLVVHATGISLSGEKSAKFNGGGLCLPLPPAS